MLGRCSILHLQIFCISASSSLMSSTMSGSYIRIEFLAQSSSISLVSTFKTFLCPCTTAGTRRPIDKMVLNFNQSTLYDDKISYRVKGASSYQRICIAVISSVLIELLGLVSLQILRSVLMLLSRRISVFLFKCAAECRTT